MVTYKVRCDILQCTIDNAYLPCGIDQSSKHKREYNSSLVIPNLLLNRLYSGLIGGIGIV